MLAPCVPAIGASSEYGSARVTYTVGGVTDVALTVNAVRFGGLHVAAGVQSNDGGQVAIVAFDDATTAVSALTLATAATGAAAELDVTEEMLAAMTGADLAIAAIPS